ncbi:MAG: DUF523 domain-containing protein [Eubacteriales bacterium]|nr:DUF523 domain-containing protein [Eubacteriales bacterium]
MMIVSRCLLGDACKYNGGDNRCEAVIDFLSGKTVFPVCPETAGGLPRPREPAEIQGSRVVDRNGVDRTDAFIEGAVKSLSDAEAYAEESGEPVEGAILKANSPSCGVGAVYDGTFSGRKVQGDGIFAGMLRKRGIPLRTEKDFSDFSDPLKSDAAKAPEPEKQESVKTTK